MYKWFTHPSAVYAREFAYKAIEKLQYEVVRVEDDRIFIFFDVDALIDNTIKHHRLWGVDFVFMKVFENLKDSTSNDFRNALRVIINSLEKNLEAKITTIKFNQYKGGWKIIFPGSKRIVISLSQKENFIWKEAALVEHTYTDRNFELIDYDEHIPNKSEITGFPSSSLFDL